MHSATANGHNNTAVEDATPKRSNKAHHLTTTTTSTITLPPPLNLNHHAPKMPRFSSLDEMPLQVNYRKKNGNPSKSSSNQRIILQHHPRSNDPPFFSRSIWTAWNDNRNASSQWENWIVSLLMMCSKPLLEYLLQLVLPSLYSPRRRILLGGDDDSSAIRHTPATTHRTVSSSYEVKGIRNYGQTCYLNTVLQSLASLEPFLVYLQKLVVWNQQRREFRSEEEEEENGTSDQASSSSSLSALLLQVLNHINGASSSSSSSASQTPNVRAILEMVAVQHAQFRSAQGQTNIGKHPQDAEELLQTLLNSVIQEAELDLLQSMPLFIAEEEDNDEDDESTATVISSFHRLQEDECFLRRHSDPTLTNASEYPNQKDTATTTTTAIPPRGEEKKQDDVFDVFIPRIDSEDDMMLRMLSAYPPGADDKDHVVEESHASSSSSLEQPNNKQVSTAMHIMMTTTSSVSPSPMSCWIGSALKCRKCQHRRPIHNTPIHSIPVVPLEVSQSLLRADNKSSSHQPACRLEDCLAEFAAVEVVQDVECRSCTIQEKKTELLEDIIMYQQAMESQSSKNKGNISHHSNDLNHLQHELDQATAKLRAIHSIDPDDDAPLEDVLRSEDFYLYNNNDSIPIRRGAAMKRMLLTRLPAVFTIHVQRRYYDPYTNRMTKTLQHVVFPELLDVAPYCAHGGISFSEGFLSQDAISKCRPIYYRLSSVIEHQGNAFYGHYVCYRRDPTSGQWYYTSDLTVKRVTWSEVSRCQAYLLFYEASS